MPWSPSSGGGDVSTPARVAVIGDALIDELVDESGTLRVVGGSALNVATGLRILGVPTTLIAMIGDDADGQLIRAHLAGYGVEFAPTLTALGTGVARSERRDGEPHYRFSEPMLHRAIAFDGDQRRAISESGVVAVSGFPLDDSPQTALLGEVLGASAGVVAIDPNPRSGMLRDAADFGRALEHLGGAVGLLKLGDDDARLLYGRSVASVVPRLRAQYTHVLATEGGDGAAVHLDGGRFGSPALATAEHVVDTMGAGDAVFASVLAEIAAHGLDGVDWDSALRRAMGVAAATIAHPGALLRTP